MAHVEGEGGDARQVVVIAPGAARPEWTPTGALAPPVVDSAADDSSLARGLEGATAAFIDAGVQAPLSLVRRLHRLVPGVQIAIVAPREARARLQRSMLFVPGLGELWILPPEDVTVELLQKAAGIGRSRRRHAERSRRVARRVAGFESVPGRRPFLADRYLATLVELLPDPVLALDEDGAVVFANPPAAAVLGVERSPSVSAEELRTTLRPRDPAAWDRLLARGREGVVRAEIEAMSGANRRVYSVAVAPVEGERPMRALLLHDVTEQVESREELAARAEELRTLMAHRSRFYAGINHELRTPVNAILGYVNLLDDGVYGAVSGPQQDAVERIARATRHLLDLVDDTLDLSRIEAGKIRVRPEPLDLPELVRDLEATMRPLAEERDVELTFDLHDSCAGQFCTDPQRLRQILTNLLSNAIHHGGGAPVEVRCRLEEGIFISEVQDRGPGIPEAQQESIFEEFFQVRESESRGTGLGLAISRALARSLGGDLFVDSEEGRGSTFRLEIPWLDAATSA